MVSLCSFVPSLPLAGSDAAECNAVLSLETNILPTLPAIPDITIAKSGNPSHRFPKVSSTMPVPLLITIAPNKGIQPLKLSRGLTCSFLIEK